MVRKEEGRKKKKEKGKGKERNPPASK